MKISPRAPFEKGCYDSTMEVITPCDLVAPLLPLHEPEIHITLLPKLQVLFIFADALPFQKLLDADCQADCRHRIALLDQRLLAMKGLYA